MCFPRLNTIPLALLLLDSVPNPRPKRADEDHAARLPFVCTEAVVASALKTVIIGNFLCLPSDHGASYHRKQADTDAEERNDRQAQQRGDERMQRAEIETAQLDLRKNRVELRWKGLLSI